ncbi:MAG: cytochrome C biogenesis protein [Micrococcales bacterium]|nr:MAG: cytochrome C biogenesis protein [Micrococcales bacterium]
MDLSRVLRGRVTSAKAVPPPDLVIDETVVVDPDTAARNAPNPRGPRLGLLGWARWSWRQLTSMRTALFLLMLLAVAAVPGSVFPQRRVDAARVATYLQDHPGIGRWLDRLGMFDVYGSVWFSAVYLLLFISLIGCIVPRTTLLVRALRSPPPRTPSRLSRLPAHRTAHTEVAPQEVLDAAERQLRRSRYRVLRQPDSVSGERGYLREAGNLVFHIALVGVLGSVAVGGLYSYRGTVVVPLDHGFVNTLSQWDTQDLGVRVDPDSLPPFQFVLTDVSVRFETDVPPSSAQFAAPRDFSATVQLRDRPGAAAREHVIRVNEPMRVNGVNVFLSGNGYAPVLTVRDSTDRVVKSGPVILLAQDEYYLSTGVVKVPDAQPQLGLDALFAPTADLDDAGPRSRFPDLLNPELFFTAFTGDLGLDAGRSQNVYTLDTSNLTQLNDVNGEPLVARMRPGDTVPLPDGAGTVTFERVSRFAGFQIQHDPAKGWALGFVAAAMLGLVLSLFVPRRRLFVRAGTGSVIEVAGLARTDDTGCRPRGVDSTARSVIRR